MTAGNCLTCRRRRNSVHSGEPSPPLRDDDAPVLVVNTNKELRCVHSRFPFSNGFRSKSENQRKKGKCDGFIKSEVGTSYVGFRCRRVSIIFETTARILVTEGSVVKMPCDTNPCIAYYFYFLI